MKRQPAPLLTKLQVTRKLPENAPELSGHLKRAWADDLERTLMQAMESPIEAHLAPGVSVMLDLSVVLRRQLVMDHRSVTWTLEPIDFSLREAVRPSFVHVFSHAMRRPFARLMLGLAWLTGSHDRFREGAQARSLDAVLGLVGHHVLSTVRIRIDVLTEMGHLEDAVGKIRDLLLASLPPSSLTSGKTADGT